MSTAWSVLYCSSVYVFPVENHPMILFFCYILDGSGTKQLSLKGSHEAFSTANEEEEEEERDGGMKSKRLLSNVSP